MSFKLDFRASLEGDTEIKRKFEDLEKTLQDVKKAAEDSSKPLEDTAKAMDDLGKSAGDVDKDLKDTSGALDDVSKSAGDIKKDLDDTAKSFDDISKSAVDVSSDLKDADSAFEDISQNANASVSSMDAVKSSFEGISQSAVEADQNIAAATTGLEGVGTATESAAAGADSLASSLDNIAASAQEAETNISAAANGIDGIGTSIGQAETALDGLGSAFDGAGTATTTFNDVPTSTGTQAQAASGGLTPLNTVLGQVGGATQQAQTGFQGFNSSLATMTGFMGVAASGALQFVTSLSNLHGAQIKLEAAQGKLSAANEAVAKAQEKLNELYASGTADAEQIAQATLDLEQALAKQGIANERAGKAQDDLNIKYAKFATDTLPQLIQTVTGTIAVLGTMKTALAGISMAGFAATIMTVGIPALAALYAGLGVFESIPALFRSVNAAIDKDTQGMIQNLTEFLSVLERFASILPGLGGAPLKLAKEALQEYAKSQGVATQATDGSIKSLLDAGEHQKNLAEATDILTGKNTNLSASQQVASDAAAKRAAAEAAVKAEIEGARAGIDAYVAGIEKEVAASGTLESALGQQNDTMATNIQQTLDLVGSQENAANALLTLGQSYADHLTKIDQLNTSLGTAEGQLLSWQNAVAAGNEAFLQWVQNTRDAAIEAETFKSNLEGMASTFGGLPGFMEGTVEEYQAFIRANEEGGAAAEEFADMALESWRGLVSAAEPLFNDLKSTWEDIFSGETFDKATTAIETANEKIRSNFEQQQADIQESNAQMWENMSSNAQGGGDKVVDVMEGVKTTTVGLFDGVDWEGLTAAMTDPFVEAFNKLPPAIADTLSQTEREALTFQAKFAQTAEMAGTAWATNLQANMSQGFDQALAQANQAAADVLAPFIEQHPETAQMFQPLFDAMNQTGPGAAQAVQDVLTEMSGMPGPVGELATTMLTNYQTKFADQLPGVTKTGVEGAIEGLGTKMEQVFEKMTERLLEGIDEIVNGTNTRLNKIEKKDPVDIKLNKEALDRDMGVIQTGIDSVKRTSAVDFAVNQEGLNTSLGNIQTGIDSVKQSTTPIISVNTEGAAGAVGTLRTSIEGIPTTKSVSVTADTSAATGAISGVTTAVNGIPATKTITVTAEASAALGATSQVTASVNAIPPFKSITITADASGVLGASASAQGSIDGVSQKSTPGIDANPQLAITATGRVQGGIDNIRQQVAPTVDVNTAAAEAKIQALGNAIARLGAGASGYAGVSLSGTGYSGAYPGQAYPGMNYAKGFGPAIVDRPMRMLVGEAGPELVAVMPMKGNRQYPQAGRQQYTPTKTAAAGMGWYGPAGGGLGYGGIPRTNTYAEAAYLLQQAQGGMQQGAMQGSEQGSMQGAQQGTEQGMQQSQPGMQDAVQQGAMQGTQQGYQEASSRIQQALQSGNMAEAMAGFGTGYGFTWGGGAQGQNLGMGGGGAQYPTAPSNTEIWGAGRFTWGGGAAGAQLGGGNMGGAQYPTAGVPLGPEHAIGFGSRPIKYTWGGGASGTTLTPSGPFVGQGLPGPDPHAFNRQPTNISTGNPTRPGGALSQPGGGVPEGFDMAEYERQLLAERDRIAKERGQTMGASSSKSFVKAFDAGVEGQSQLINGVPATILSGNSRGAREAGNQAGTAAGQGFAEGFNTQMPSGGLTQGQAGYPKAYTGEVPASYGKPLGQLINGIAATILPGQGPRGPPMQAAFGMHRNLRRDTLIQAHRNERVDISPNTGAGEAVGKANDYANAAIDRITNLLEKLLSQGNTFKVDFNVDGRKLSSVAAKHMGTTGYGDK